MLELNSLRNHLLIAMPGLDGSWFGGTVTYLCEHNADGAMGLVLNKPSSIEFSDICEQLDIDRRSHIAPTILQGGPVSPEQGFILHEETGDWGATMNITERTHLTSSQDILRAIALGARGTLVGRPFLYALGAAGETGVVQMLEILHTELDKTMALCGRSTLAEVDGSILLS